MARKRSHQRGAVELRNGLYTLRYWLYDWHTQEWTHPRTVLGEVKDFKNLKAAKKAAEPIMAKVNEQNNVKPSQRQPLLTFAEFIKEYWRKYEANHQPTTRELRDSLLRRHLLPAFGDKLIKEITPEHITDFLAELQAKYKAGTQRAIYNFLVVLFKLANDYDLIGKSPVRASLHSPDAKSAPMVALDGATVYQVINNLRTEQERLFLLLISALGLRVREGFALRWCDLSGNILSVNHTLHKGELKRLKTDASKARMILDPPLPGMLEHHRRQSPFRSPSDFIFCQADGSPLSYFSFLRHLQKAIKGAGIAVESHKHGFHLFRRSAATILKGKAGDMDSVQNFLRHTEQKTTKLYVIEEAPAITGAGVILEEILPKEEERKVGNG